MEDKTDISSVIEELKRLNGEIELVADLPGLKPIFYRIEEINKEHSAEFEVQLLISDVKQHLVNRGMLLKQHGGSSTVKTPTGDQSHHIPAPPGTPSSSSERQVQDAGGTMTQPARISERPSSSREVYVPPTRTPQPMPTPGPPPIEWKKPAVVGAAIGLVIVLGIFGTLSVMKKKKPPVVVPAGQTVAVQVNTNPPGAAVSVDEQFKCTSNCRVDLAPGKYTVKAVLAGYDPAFQPITVTSRHPVELILPLATQPEMLRVFTDLRNAGQVLLDDKPWGALQDGQLMIDRVPPGKHTLRVTGQKGSEAKFSFELTPGAPPVIDGPLTANNLVAVLASSFGNQIHVHTSVTPLKVALDGNAYGETTANGIDLKNVQPGDRELELNDGKDERKLVVSVTPSPVLTMWVNEDTTGGGLVVMTGEDGATVFLDGKPYPRKTKRGRLWIPNLPPKEYKIRVVKQGFQDAPEQTAEVKKGAEVRREFKLQAIPRIAVLHIKGATAGADVFIDKEHVGKIEADGTFSYSNVAPGEHTVELKLEQHVPKTMKLTFRPAETLELSGDAVALAPATGTLKIAVVPADAQVTLKRSDGRLRPIQAGNQTLPVGSYTISAKAPGYSEATANVQVVSGEVVTADLKLIKESAGTARTVESDWMRPGEWRAEGGWKVHRGGGFVPFSAQPSTGTFTFSAQLAKGGSLFGGKHIQWYLDYHDPKNYVSVQIDKKSLQWKIFENGKEVRKKKIDLVESEPPFTVQIVIGENSITHRIRDEDKWIDIDTFSKPGAGTGRFGFYIPGNDEVAVSNFRFVPK